MSNHVHTETLALDSHHALIFDLSSYVETRECVEIVSLLC